MPIEVVASPVPAPRADAALRADTRVSAVRVDPRTDALWRLLVRGRPSDVFHAPAWIEVLAETYGFTTAATVLRGPGGRPLAGVAFCPIADDRGERLVGLPFSDYGDPLVDDAAQWGALADDLLAERRPVLIRTLHARPPEDDPRFEEGKRARWHGVDLRPDTEALWSRLDSASRRAIRKAGREGAGVRVADHPRDLEAFYAMHVRVRKSKYRLLAQPFRFFEAIWERFLVPGDGALLLAERRGEVLGGALYLTWKDRLYYKFNASRPDVLDVRPNDLVLWEGICFGKARGLRFLDLGLSDWDQEGLIRYKRKYATEEGVIRFLRHDAPADGVPEGPAGAPEVTPGVFRGLLPALTDLFTDPEVPDAVTRRAGDLLYRYFT